MRLPSPVPAEFAALSQREITVDGCRISYTEAGSGPTVVLLHGAVFAGNVFWWETQAALAPFCRTVAPDYPGWGASEKPDGPYDMAQYHRFISAFLDAMDLEQAVIIGHSMSGLIGSAYALLHPERVRAFVVLAAAPAWADITVPRLFQPFLLPGVGELMMFFAPFIGPDLPLGVRRFYQTLMLDVNCVSPERLREALVGCLEATAERAHRRAFIRTVRANAAYFDGGNGEFRALAKDFHAPVTLIAANDDPLFPVEMIRRSVKGAPNVTLKVLDACGHFPTWEQPEAVRDLLLEVIASAHPALKEA